MRNKLAETQHFFLNFKHFIMKVYLSSAILFQVLTAIKKSRIKTRDRSCFLVQVRIPEENEVYPGDFYATTHVMDIKPKQNN